MTFSEYFEEVLSQAKLLGYDSETVACFIGDIRWYFESGFSVEECVEREF